MPPERSPRAPTGPLRALSTAHAQRTSLYADGFYEAAAGTDSTGKAAVANFSGSTYSSTQWPPSLA
ncbi:hypothetical protein [Paraburkholderia sp. GAS348]|uniref:hypothetical protein n=1 Tax=Paraburkholderia sp. GAS348 TaxID=3035132 RepID=UPI003D251871